MAMTIWLKMPIRSKPGSRFLVRCVSFPVGWLLGLGPLNPVVSALRAWTRLRPFRPEDKRAGGSIVESFTTKLSTSSPVGLGASSRLAWQESPGRKLRTCVGAPSWRGRPISLKRANQPIPIHQRAQAAAQGAAGQAPTPAQPQQQPSTPPSPSSTTTVSIH